MIDLPTLFNWLFQTAVAFVSTIAFSIIFHTPKGMALLRSLPGAWAGWCISSACI